LRKNRKTGELGTQGREKKKSQGGENANASHEGECRWKMHGKREDGVAKTLGGKVTQKNRRGGGELAGRRTGGTTTRETGVQGGDGKKTSIRRIPSDGLQSPERKGSNTIKRSILNNPPTEIVVKTFEKKKRKHPGA